MKRRQNSKGAVLIVTIWVLLFFAAITAVFAARVQSQMAVIKRITEGVGSRAQAYSAISYVNGLIKKEDKSDTAAPPPSAYSGFWVNNPTVFKHVETFEGSGSFFSIGYYADLESGGSQEVTFGLRDEESKININYASKDVLSRLYSYCDQNQTTSPEDLAKETVAWRDRKSEFKEFGTTQGADTAAGFGSVEELLMVPGMSYSLWENIKKYLTVYGSGQVNLNTVSKKTLNCLGISTSLADRIVEYRNSFRAQAKSDAPVAEEPFKDLGDLEQKIGVVPAEDTQLQNISSLWTFESSTFYFIASSDSVSGARGDGFQCVVNRDGEILSVKDF